MNLLREKLCVKNGHTLYELDISSEMCKLDCNQGKNSGYLEREALLAGKCRAGAGHVWYFDLDGR